MFGDGFPAKESLRRNGVRRGKTENGESDHFSIFVFYQEGQKSEVIAPKLMTHIEKRKNIFWKHL